MQKTLLFFLLISFFSADLFGQSNPLYDINLIPKELLENAHTVVRQEVYNVEIPSYDKYIIQHKKVVTILKEKSNEDYLQLNYNSFSKINRIEASIYDASGNLVRKFKKKDMQDYSSVSGSTMYADSRVKYLDFNHPTYPYTIEVVYKKTVNRLMFYPMWEIQDFGVSIEQASFIVTTNDIGNLNYKTLNTKLNPTKVLQGEENVLTWKVENSPAIENVNYSTHATEVLPYVLLSPKQFKLGRYDGRMDSWKDFGNFMNRLNYGRDVLSPEMITTVKALTATAKSDREKADILYKYLQENTRYISVQIGVGGWQTFDVDYVEKNKYGDCKALTYFMKAMLSAVDVPSYPVLISRYNNHGLILDDFVYPSFNHVLLKLASEDYFLECTSTYAPPNYIGNGNENRKALLITERGGELIQTPSIPPEENKESNKAIITLSENGDATINNEGLISGILQDNLRWKSFENTQEELEKEFITDCGLPSALVKTYNLKPSLEKPEIHIHYDIHVRKYAVKSGKRFFVPLNAINPFSTVPAKTERSANIELQQGYMMDDELTLILPKDYEIESIPDASTLLESPYGTYKLELITKADKLIYKRTLKMYSINLPASEYEDFRTFRKQVADIDSAKLVLVKKKKRT